MATSGDALHWDAHETIMQRGPEDSGGANHPGLLITGERWWLFYTGYPGASGGQGSVLVAAVSQTGASWDRVGTILEPEMGEAAVSHPARSRSRGPSTCSMPPMQEVRSARRWRAHPMAFRGTVEAWSWNLEPQAPTASASIPRALKRRDGSLEMWYAGLPVEDDGFGYRICSARFPGPWST